MSYRSTINAFSFHSKLAPDELRAAYVKFAEGSEDKHDRSYLMDSGAEPFYGFEMIEKADNAKIPLYGLEMDDYYAKHYADNLLAEFVSTVIAPVEHTIIELVGEDSTQRGYLVLRGEVLTIEYEKTVQGMDIGSYIKKYKEAHNA